MKPLKNITLEMSLKPFASNASQDIRTTCLTFFEQWKSLLNHAETVSVLLWVADGSEILDYTGDFQAEMEWAKYIGGANPRMNWDKQSDPERRGLHARYYLYREEPPIYTYGDLKKIIQIIKEIGAEVLGKAIQVGETFDPGPEFAKSDFKYNRHNEICIGESMGKSSMVCCYGILNGDTHHYAAYPEGIPSGTPFGTFLGKQSQIFLKDMGFDYLWLSNGFGFGTETWGTTGATFDGKAFYPEKVSSTEQKILDFWKLFRKECNYPVQTRGTNLTVGIDSATDAVNVKQIYDGNFHILPPPNSPWAAIDGNFGLELMGYLSRMAELPDEDYLFRFYAHDPWWMNSPWLDRYEGQPHDIYLPLATARINEKGEIGLPSQVNILTIDNSLGEMPEKCANEITAFMIDALNKAPDMPSPFVLVYPFREYQDGNDLRKPFFEDWFAIGVINKGLPINTVVSTDRFISFYEKDTSFLKDSVLVTPIPDKESKMKEILLDFVKQGGKVMLYGSTTKTDDTFLSALGLANITAVTGDFAVKTDMEDPDITNHLLSNRLTYDDLLTDGGLSTIVSHDKVKVLVSAKGIQNMPLLTFSQLSAGSVVWCRGCNCARLADKKDEFPLERSFVLAAKNFGYYFGCSKKFETDREPTLAMHRSQGLCYLSGYMPDITVTLKLQTPLGAPVLTGTETYLENGCSVYHMPRAWSKECRVFVIGQQDNEKLVCKELAPVSYLQRHRLILSGLKNATIYVLSHSPYGQYTELLLNSPNPYLVSERFEQEEVDTVLGKAICAKNITGTMIISDCAANFR